jgi:tRNA nucleotidyltransferase (CCA-adding enzyme)
VTDLDLEVYGLDPKRFDAAMGELGAAGVGRSFIVYKYGGLDIALPRREHKTGPGHRGFTVEPAEDPREASRRRDFTVNALMYDPAAGEILDYWGGLEDLERRRLRRVDPAHFAEDSLRVLRAMRFAAQLGFKVEEETCRLCRSLSLEDLPGSRIFGEFERMFRADAPARGLQALLELGIAGRLWGEKGGPLLLRAAGRDMIRYRAEVPPMQRDFFFLAVYGQHTAVPMTRILEAIDAPRRYRRALEELPKLPATLTPEFVGALAEREGVRASPLAYHPLLRRLARKIGVWDRPLVLAATPRELLTRGFRGAALGQELARLRRERLRQLAETWNPKEGQ